MIRKRVGGWWRARVRAIGPGRHKPDRWYVRFTPSFGFSLPWLGTGRRLRFARHHGLQVVVWKSGKDQAGVPWGRWYVVKQLLGRSTVKGERFLKS